MAKKFKRVIKKQSFEVETLQNPIDGSSFFTLIDFKDNREYKKNSKGKFGGVYIWGFCLSSKFDKPKSIDDFFPYYVGKHNKDMFSRTHDHISSLSGGMYSLFDVDKYVNKKKQGKTIEGIGTIGKKYKNALIEFNKKNSSKLTLPTNLKLPNDSAFPFLRHFPEGVHNMFDFHIPNGNKMKSSCKQTIDWMLRHFCIIYLKPINKNKSQSPAIDLDECINELETRIGQTLGYENLVTERKIKTHDEITLVIKILKNNYYIKNINSKGTTAEKKEAIKKDNLHVFWDATGINSCNQISVQDVS